MLDDVLFSVRFPSTNNKFIRNYIIIVPKSSAIHKFQNLATFNPKPAVNEGFPQCCCLETPFDTIQRASGKVPSWNITTTLSKNQQTESQTSLPLLEELHLEKYHHSTVTLGRTQNISRYSRSIFCRCSQALFYFNEIIYLYSYKQPRWLI